MAGLVTDPKLIQQLEAASSAGTPPAAGPVQQLDASATVTDPDLIRQLEAAQSTPAGVDPKAAIAAPSIDNPDAYSPQNPPPGITVDNPQPKQAEVRSYEPTWREKIAAAIADKLPSLGASPDYARHVAAAIMGTTGTPGSEQIGMVDFTPGRIPLSAQEAGRAYDAGHYGTAALDAFAALPGPVVGKAVDAVAGGGDALINAFRNWKRTPISQAGLDADQLGITIPKALDLPKNAGGTIMKGASGILESHPIFGGPISQAKGDAAKAIEAKGTDLARQVSPAFDQETAASAGGDAKDAIEEWVRRGSGDVSERLFEGVRAQMQTPVTGANGQVGMALGHMPTTTSLVNDLERTQLEGASTVYNQPIQMVADAISRPNGMSFDGMMHLRTVIGATADFAHLDPQGGTVEPALRRLYGAISEDLGNLVRDYGGQTAVRDWQRANRVHELIAERRQDLTKIIGRDASKPDESVLDKLVAMAGSKGTADIANLTNARKAMGADPWRSVSSQALARLWRDPAGGGFSISKFASNYGNLSDAGKRLLFNDPAMRSQLDALARLADEYKHLEKFKNGPRTATTLEGFKWLQGGGDFALAGFSPPLLVAKWLPSAALTYWLQSPVKLRAYNNYLTQALQTARTAATNSGLRTFTVPTPLKVAAKGLADLIARDTDADPEEIAAALTGQANPKLVRSMSKAPSAPVSDKPSRPDRAGLMKAMQQ